MDAYYWRAGLVVQLARFSLGIYVYIYIYIYIYIYMYIYGAAFRSPCVYFILDFHRPLLANLY